MYKTIQVDLLCIKPLPTCSLQEQQDFLARHNLEYVPMPFPHLTFVMLYSYVIADVYSYSMLALTFLRFLYPLMSAKQRISALLKENVKLGPEVTASGRAFGKLLKVAGFSQFTTKASLLFYL